MVFLAVGFLCDSVGASEHLYSDSLTEEKVRECRQSYGGNREKLEAYRQKTFRSYQKATESGKKDIVQAARRELEKQMRGEIFPAWDGTVWDFNGISRVPGEGKVACGYFVSTCLVHLGFQVSRIRLAQQPSQRIIETFMPKSERNILAGGVSMEKVRAYLKTQGDGIYIVGSDTHVGFVSVEGDDMAFIHSSYYRPDAVVKTEKVDSKNPLSDSKYRVFGKIFADDMVIKWLGGHKYVVKR